MSSSIPKEGTGPPGPSPGAGAAEVARAGRLRPDPGAASRSFVVQVGPGLSEGDEAFSGRVQHLATADGGNFVSAEGLVEIMRRVLRRAVPTEPGTGTDED